MDIKNILNTIEQAEVETTGLHSTRRDLLMRTGAKVAMASLPFALGAIFNKAYGKSTDTISGVLNYALSLEYLEYNFYATAIEIESLVSLNIPSSDLASLTTIMQHEYEHVFFLRQTLSAMGAEIYTPPGYMGDPLTGNPVSLNSYDFTLGGSVPTNSNYGTFLTLAQAFEDTGVRAYKGQAGNLQGNEAILGKALQIHSVEARHASHIRYMRRKAGVVDVPKPWITGSAAPATLVQASYNGEGNTVQAGIDITTLQGINGNISTSAASEAFDEPLTEAQVLAIVTPFFTA